MEMQVPCRWIVKSEQETRELGRRLAPLLQPGDVLALEGDLGAGKTTFTQGVAQGLGIETYIDSPTFTLIKEYHGRLPLYHMDVYRLEGSDEDLGWDEYFYGDGVTLVEWASRIRPLLPEETVWFTFHVLSTGEREIRLHLRNARSKRMCEELSGI
jgi:tRNA threonylcarbamoyladenosine biosynthesis protein TsaE